MRTKSTLKKLGLAMLCAMGMGYNANATVFTAVLSGNFNSATTWGGIIPSSILSSDIIIIPSGVTVTLNVTAAFSGSSSLTVDGTLNSGTYGTALKVASGTFSGSGNINVDSLELGVTSGYSFTGNIMAHTATSLGTNLSSASNVKVSNMLMLTSGTMNVASGSLTMGNGSSIELAGGTLSASGSGMLHLDSIYHVVYATSSVSTGAELSGSGLRNVTLNTSGAVTMTSNLGLNGNLTLTSGTLMLNGHSLTFNSGANLAASGSGMLSGNSSSDVNIMSSGSLAGSLMFAAGGNTLHDLTVNMGSGSAMANLGNSINVTGNLNLQMGKLMLGNNNLTVASGAMVMGGSSSSYVVTNGTGTLMMHLGAGSTASFKVGSATNYSPIDVAATSSSATGDVSVNVAGDVYAAGTTGASIATSRPLVKNTWHVSSTATTGIDYSMTAMWSTGMEVNAFDRSHAYLAHYTGGAWDVSGTSAATASGSMYTVTRTGITSLSPFTVADNTTFGTSGVATATAKTSTLVLYPNPVENTLYLTSGSPVTDVYIYSLSGQLINSEHVAGNNISVANLPAGMYTLHAVGTGFTADQTFIKK